MHESNEILNDHIFPIISDKLTKDEFDENLDSLQTKTGNLIDKEVLGYMLLSKFGRKPVNIKEMLDLNDGSEISVIVEISSVEPTREFIRKDGQKGKVISLYADDVTGRCRIVLWDTHHQELVEKNEITKGTKLLVANTKMKDGKFGIELNPQKNSIMKILTGAENEHWDWLMGRRYIEKAGDEFSLQNIQELYEGAEYPSVNIKATIQSTGQLREFNRRSGGVGHVINFRIYDGTAEAILTLWDKLARDFSELKIGDIVFVNEGRPKMREGMVEIHSGYKTIIEIK